MTSPGRPKSQRTDSFGRGQSGESEIYGAESPFHLGGEPKPKPESKESSKKSSKASSRTDSFGGGQSGEPEIYGAESPFHLGGEPKPKPESKKSSKKSSKKPSEAPSSEEESEPFGAESPVVIEPGGPLPPGGSEGQQGDERQKDSKFNNAFKLLSPLQRIPIVRGVPRPYFPTDVALGDPVTGIDARIAYQIWLIPDEELRKEWKRSINKDSPYRRSTVDPIQHCLSLNIYEHLMIDPLLPISQDDASERYYNDANLNAWDAGAIIDDFSDTIFEEVEGPLEDIDDWEEDGIKALLESRGKSTEGEKFFLIQRAKQSELEEHFGIMPLSDLTHWGVEKKKKFLLQPVGKQNMGSLDMYTMAVHLSPYNPAYWTGRAYCHYRFGLFDLALGDAYRAQLLCDVLTNPDERFRQAVGLETRVKIAIKLHILASDEEAEEQTNEGVDLFDRIGATYFTNSLTNCYESIIHLSLAALGSWHDLNPNHSLVNTGARLLTNGRDAIVPELRSKLYEPVRDTLQQEMMEGKDLFWHERFQGRVSTLLVYPYAVIRDPRQHLEPSFVEALNRNVFKKVRGDTFNSKEICRVEKTEDDALAVFAVRDIEAGELIYYEEPTIRGHLQPRRLLRADSTFEIKARCENCKRELEITKELRRCGCFPEDHLKLGPNDRVFCKPPTSEPEDPKNGCQAISEYLHHFGSCGVDWSWLYDAMRPVIVNKEWAQKQSQYITRCNDMYGTMHSLLLRSIFEITLNRREHGAPNLSPLEMDELLALSDHSEETDWFPFSFVGNITVPFDILASMGVDIFRDLSFDTWVIQKIIRKLLANAVPWDAERRGDDVPRFLPGDKDKTPEEPKDQDDRMRDQEESFKEWDPSFMNLYLFPGLSLFRQAADQNATWGYDKDVPNRVLIWATKNIKKGEEITIRDRHGKFDKEDTEKIAAGPDKDQQKEKRKVNDYARVEDHSLVFYRDTKSSTLQYPRKRRRKEEPAYFHRSQPTSQSLLKMHAKLYDDPIKISETVDELQKRKKELAENGLAFYRYNQRVEIDTKDVLMGRAMRWRKRRPLPGTEEDPAEE